MTVDNFLEEIHRQRYAGQEKYKWHMLKTFEFCLIIFKFYTEIFWTDEDDDKIQLRNDEQLKHALEINKNIKDKRTYHKRTKFEVEVKFLIKKCSKHF